MQRRWHSKLPNRQETPPMNRSNHPEVQRVEGRSSGQRLSRRLLIEAIAETIEGTDHGNKAFLSHLLKRQHHKKSDVHKDKTADGHGHCRIEYSRQVTGRMSHVGSNKANLRNVHDIC